MKKGQMSSMFKYIFGFIVGSMFLLFFIGFAYYYMGFAGDVGSAELVTVLDDDLTAFSVSQSAEKTLDYNMDFDLTISEARIMSGGQTKTTDKALYSEMFLEGEVLDVATKQLSIPFAIMNLFYLDDNSILYVFVYDDEDVYDDISVPGMLDPIAVAEDELNLDDLSLVQNQYSKIRFVFLTSNSHESEISSKFANYDILEVSSSLEDYSYGTVSYEDEDVVYLGYPMLIGAIMAENAEAYSYNFDIVLSKLSVVSGVYYEKSKLLSARLPECEYSGIKTALNNFKASLSSVESASVFYSKVENLDELNKNLGGECPEVY